MSDHTNANDSNPGLRTASASASQCSVADSETATANGFAIIRAALSPDELAVSLEVEIFRGHRGDVNGLPCKRETLVADTLLGRCLAIHFPHKISPFYHRMLSNPVIVAGLKGVIGLDDQLGEDQEASMKAVHLCTRSGVRSAPHLPGPDHSRV